jgi:hypothetical protein
VVKNLKSPGLAELALSEHDLSKFNSLRLDKLLFAGIIIDDASQGVKKIFDIFLLLRVLCRVPFPILTEELKEGIDAVQPNELFSVLR